MSKDCRPLIFFHQTASSSPVKRLPRMIFFLAIFLGVSAIWNRLRGVAYTAESIWRSPMRKFLESMNLILFDEQSSPELSFFLQDCCFKSCGRPLLVWKLTLQCMLHNGVFRDFFYCVTPWCTLNRGVGVAYTAEFYFSLKNSTRKLTKT